MDVCILKKVASSFATGVSIIAHYDLEQNKINAMTVSSFVSVSLSPPLVSFCIGDHAKMFTSLHVTQLFGISILNDEQRHLSNHFAGIKQQDVSSLSVFEMKNNAPVIRDCLGWYYVRCINLVPAGDHQIVVCEVIDADRNKNESMKPLLYFSGTYVD